MDGKKIKLQIWDTAGIARIITMLTTGQERFRTITTGMHAPLPIERM
jgi:GTPase SAR1 family protein